MGNNHNKTNAKGADSQVSTNNTLVNDMFGDVVAADPFKEKDGMPEATKVMIKAKNAQEEMIWVRFKKDAFIDAFISAGTVEYLPKRKVSDAKGNLFSFVSLAKAGDTSQDISQKVVANPYGVPPILRNS